MGTIWSLVGVVPGTFTLARLSDPALYCAAVSCPGRIVSRYQTQMSLAACSDCSSEHLLVISLYFFFLNIYIFLCVCVDMSVPLLCVWSEDKWPQAWLYLLNHPSDGLQCFVYIVYILGERVKTGLSPGLI